MKNLFTLLLILQSVIISLPAQDLIERTQQNHTSKIVINNQEKPNRLAELVAKNRKHAKTAASVSVFTFNENKSAKTTENVVKSVELSLENAKLLKSQVIKLPLVMLKAKPINLPIWYFTKVSSKTTTNL